jgi:L-histidine Nalpha-methyltransferase
MTMAMASNRPVVAQFREAMGGEGSTLLRAAQFGDVAADFAQSVVAGMSASPRNLECRFLYDAVGSDLFERICDQPEYYQTRTEAALLADHAADIARRTGPVTLVELGSGSSVKTDHLLAAYRDHDPLITYVPIDVSPMALREAIRRLDRAQPDVRVVGVNGRYEDAFPLLVSAAPNLVVFLGSTIGNFTPAEYHLFWRKLEEHLSEGDYVLLGVDLIKSPVQIEAAYNDAAGVTARFTTNLFARMNRELGAGLRLDGLAHEARWNPDAEQVEIHMRFTERQVLRVAPLGREFTVEARERIGVEISRKFDLDRVARDVAGHGFLVEASYVDPQRWFGLMLLRREPL